MTAPLRIALAQINPLVGDADGNAEMVIREAARARDELQCEIAVFPELAVCGYPPEDLLLRGDFLAACERALQKIVDGVRGITLVVGHPHREGDKVFNALSVIRDAGIIARYHKRELPNYTVFDEKRYFCAGAEAAVVEIHGRRIALGICEDIWQGDAVRESVALGAELMLVINASPFHDAQAELREDDIVREHARAHALPMVYVNQVGGQDELVFDGGSLAVNADGEIAARLPAFESALQAVAFADGKFAAGDIAPRLPRLEMIYRAIGLGVRDYVDKNRFDGVVLGLSGGIDSALCLCIACDALGAERVAAVMMPSRFTAEMSVSDARAQADALGVRLHVIDIEPMVQAIRAQLAPAFEGVPVREGDVTHENIQARIRGALLMAMANRLGFMTLATGNKSEMAVGYATLYGDMAGGFAAIKDVPKTLVYELARYRNTLGAVIPERVLTRAPSAELAADQKDSDSLPAYEVLDPILESFIERDRAVADMIADGFRAEDVRRAVALVAKNEHKRRQAAPGVRITARAFGRDRRYPITSRFF